jgi:transcriptional regulator of arginine metabolism
MHNMWREELIRLINKGAFKTQGGLVSALKSAGYDVNQASVSRELKSREVHKVDGHYASENGSLPANVPIRDAQATQSGPMVVLRTTPASASMLARFIDDAHLSGVLGTLAGNDTVFVACADENGACTLAGWLKRDIPGLMRGRTA